MQTTLQCVIFIIQITSSFTARMHDKQRMQHFNLLTAHLEVTRKGGSATLGNIRLADIKLRYAYCQQGKLSDVQHTIIRPNQIFQYLIWIYDTKPYQYLFILLEQMTLFIRQKWRNFLRRSQWLTITHFVLPTRLWGPFLRKRYHGAEEV